MRRSSAFAARSAALALSKVADLVIWPFSMVLTSQSLPRIVMVTLLSVVMAIPLGRTASLSNKGCARLANKA